MTKYFIAFLVCFSVMISCKKPTPQLPSNKGEVVDEDAATMLLINKNLAIQEDSILNEFVTKSNLQFTKSPLGFWYKVDVVLNSEEVDKLGSCKYMYEISRLDGTLLDKGKSQIEFDKKQTIPGLEEGLKLLHKGESATFIIPWYLGYGMKGNENLIPAYTSLIYKIKIVD